VGPGATAAAPSQLGVCVYDVDARDWLDIGMGHSLEQSDLWGVIGVGLRELQYEVDGGTSQ
jgi:hypothetical protein